MPGNEANMCNNNSSLHRYIRGNYLRCHVKLVTFAKKFTCYEEIECGQSYCSIDIYVILDK